MEGDLDIYDLERVLKTQEEEDDEEDMSIVRGSEVIRGTDYRNVEFDENTGRGLVSSNSTCFQRDLGWGRFTLF